VECAMGKTVRPGRAAPGQGLSATPDRDSRVVLYIISLFLSFLLRFFLFFSSLSIKEFL
jgi:hypothetical protein